MSKIAFLGLGAMGSRMAANLVRAGHDLTVWNLSPDPARRLAALGAKAAPTPRDAAAGNDFVMTMVTNDQASRQVWLDPSTGALAGMKPGSIAIESSTLTPDWVRELAGTMNDAGVSLLDAMVSGSTPQAENATLVYLVGGEGPALQRAGPVLSALGSTIRHAGPAGCGALAKLATNALMGVQMAALAELIGMLIRNNADPATVMNAVAATDMWNAHLTRDLGSMISRQFDPLFPVRLLEKDLSYTVKTGGETQMPTVRAVRDLFQTAVDKNLGDLNMTALLKLFVKDD